LADIDAFVTIVGEEFDKFETNLANDLQEILDEAAENAGLADVIGEANEYSDKIKAEIAAEIADAKALGEIQIVGKKSKINLLLTLASAKSNLDAAENKDEVDEVLAAASQNFRIAVSSTNA
jgi:hypothetical protein